VLVRHGRLGGCTANRLVVQVVDVRLSPAGIVARGSGASARATRVTVTAGARVLADGAEPWNLGTASGEEVIATTARGMDDPHARAAAVVSAGRQAGRQLAGRLLEGTASVTVP